ncbi:MAG: integrase, partial [Rhodospirillaceae bacterium]|nr:integrase [Rhodospirillaceae bacterium]
MALKKQEFKDDEIPIFDEACVYKRGEYWQFRMWLAKENKYARKSLRTRSETTAVERG